MARRDRTLFDYNETVKALLFWLLVTAAVQIPLAASQESIGIEPDLADIQRWVNDSDIIVTGTYRLGPRLPWFDGWHYLSQIEIQDRVAASEGSKIASVPWIRPYFRTICFGCDGLDLEAKNGIWFLRRQGSDLAIVAGPGGLCNAMLDIRYLDVVRNAARGKTQAPK